MIALFRKAGIRDVTPNHVIDESEWEALNQYIKSIRESKTKEVYRDASPLAARLVVVQDINARLLQELARRPQLVHDLDPRKFEELVAKLLEDQGCDVTLTKRTRDGGYDLLGRMKVGPANLIFLAECKKYSPQNKVGVEVVRGLYGVTEIQKANLGLIITTSTFTKDAHEEKLRIGPRIDLKEYSDLCSWLSAYSIVG
ncbi:restriction endonuclease [Accumulibacter sp.]|uniref:restriction endonuclease n=1 Tax=Accumulibacter sp. TaxID=2053492 RepID=UPI00257C5955|nr:restriction endonuclease [Accumulibacter sp.]